MRTALNNHTHDKRSKTSLQNVQHALGKKRQQRSRGKALLAPPRPAAEGAAGAARPVRSGRARIQASYTESVPRAGPSKVSLRHAQPWVGWTLLLRVCKLPHGNKDHVASNPPHLQTAAVPWSYLDPMASKQLRLPCKNSCFKQSVCSLGIGPLRSRRMAGQSPNLVLSALRTSGYTHQQKQQTNKQSNKETHQQRTIR